jgi:hypothetical protein
MKTRLTPAESLLIVCLFAFNPLLLKFLDQILSDIPFLFFSTLTLFLISSTGTYKNWQLVVLGISIFIAAMIRTQGILLLLSFLAVHCMHLWKSRTNRQVWNIHVKNMAVVAITFGLLWLLYTPSFPGGNESYLIQYTRFQASMAVSFINNYFHAFNLFFGENSIWTIFYYIFFAFFLVGAWKKRREDTVLIIFFCFWMILIITWPSWQGARFIFPLLPIFVYFLFQGMKLVLEKLQANYARIGLWVFYGFWSIVITLFLFNSIVTARDNLKNDRAINGPFDLYSQEVYQYIKEKTSADSVVVFFKPRVMRLMTDHASIMSTECDRILKGDYLVLSKKVGENQQIPPERIDSCNLPLTRVLSNSRFIVYQIQK